MDYLRNQFDDMLREAKKQTEDIEQYAKDHVNHNPDDVERELHQRFLMLKNRINEQLSSIENFVHEQAPKKNDPDYENKTVRYKEFLCSAMNAVKTMSNQFIDFLTKLSEAIVQIAKWITENLPSIIAAITLLFEKVIVPLRNRKSN